MLYRTLADLIVFAHFAFIAFAVFGGLLALRWRWMPWIHVPTLVWSVVIAIFGWICPLTPLENSLRRLAGHAEYTGGFIDQYLVPIIYPADLTRELQLLLGSALAGFNLAVYLLLWRYHGTRDTRGGSE